MRNYIGFPRRDGFFFLTVFRLILINWELILAYYFGSCHDTANDVSTGFGSSQETKGRK